MAQLPTADRRRPAWHLLPLMLAAGLTAMILQFCGGATDGEGPLVDGDGGGILSIAEGKLRLVVSTAPRVELSGVGFRLVTGAGTLDPSHFGAPVVGTKGQPERVNFEGPAGSGVAGLAVAATRTGASGATVRLETTVTAAPGKELSLRSFELVVPPGGVTLEGLGAEVRMLQNGYQSWSFTGGVALRAPFNSPVDKERSLLANGGSGDPLQERLGISWWFGSLSPSANGPALTVGATSSERWRTAVLPRLPSAGRLGVSVVQGTSGDPITVPAGGAVTLEGLALAAAPTVRAAMAGYVAAVAERTPPLAPKPTVSPMGWWSWNVFFDDVTEKQVKDHAKLLADKLATKGFKLIELDDGYQTKWGLWEENHPTRFPSGLASLVKEIKGKGLHAGLWLAPFLVDTSTELAKKHLDWFVKDRQGNPLVHRQIGVESATHVLDPTNPEAAKHLKGVFARLSALGIEWFKLDFLYAGALPGKRKDPKVTGIEALRLGLKQIHEAAPKAHINLCGMPVLPAIGRGHSLRFGTDIAFKGMKLGQKQIVHEARNVMLRSYLDPLIRNDPDQVLVRNPLTDSQARSAATLGAMTGFYTAGDDLTALAQDRLALLTHTTLLEIAGLRRSAVALDPLSVVGEVIWTPVLDPGKGADPATAAPTQFFLRKDPVRSWLAVFNWSSKTRQQTVDVKGLQPGLRTIRDVWRKLDLPLPSDGLEIGIPARDVVLLELRR